MNNIILDFNNRNMKLNNQMTIGRLIAKIDNDFNLSESDWIPRVAAWVTDALSQMKVLPMEKKRRKLEVSERIAQFPCTLNVKELRVFDNSGNEIQPIDNNKCCSGLSENTSSPEIAIIDDTNITGVNYMRIANISNSDSCRNYNLDCDKIELNFDTDYVTVESYETACYYDDYYECYCPYIIDNGLLLESLAWYCLFKYLSRGSKHPVYSLLSDNYAINPFLQWNNLKAKAAASAKIDLNKNAGYGWNNFFYNSTFLPRS